MPAFGLAYLFREDELFTIYGKKTATPGKREKFSRQYAFSCMLECGFCGASLSRRSWHSSSKYQKTIWQCVKSTKHGKRYCPDSKGIPEQVIEEAFIESYRMLCADNKDVLTEFIARVEKTLSEDSVRDKLMKYQKSADNLQSKRKSLLEKYLGGIVSQDIYEETDVGYERKLSDIKANIAMLEQQMEDEVSLKRRVADFKKALSQNEVLQEFDRGIFESIIEKVIVGGYDEDGNKDPYKITFIYKTGLKNEIGNAKERFDKSKSVGDKAKELCSHITDEMKDVCSYVSDITCGDGCSFVPTETKAGCISQVKRKCGIEVGKNLRVATRRMDCLQGNSTTAATDLELVPSPNLPKNEDSRQPQCPEDKESAIVEALKHFKMNS